MNKPVPSNGYSSTDLEEKVTEVPVLLSVGMLQELEAVACEHGLTCAELLRGLIMRFLDCVKEDG